MPIITHTRSFVNSTAVQLRIKSLDILKGLYSTMQIRSQKGTIAWVFGYSEKIQIGLAVHQTMAGGEGRCLGSGSSEPCHLLKYFLGFNLIQDSKKDYVRQKDVLMLLKVKKRMKKQHKMDAGES
jgi:hypothetical protein